MNPNYYSEFCENNLWIIDSSLEFFINSREHLMLLTLEMPPRFQFILLGVLLLKIDY